MVRGGFRPKTGFEPKTRQQPRYSMTYPEIVTIWFATGRGVPPPVLCWIAGGHGAVGNQVENTSFPVLLGELEDVLAAQRRDLAGLVDLSNAMAVLAPRYSRESEHLARRIARIEQHAGLIERLIPFEDRVRALADYLPLALLPAYAPIEPDCGLIGLEALVRGVVEDDCGSTAKVLFSWPGAGKTRLQVARGEIVAVRRTG